MPIRKYVMGHSERNWDLVLSLVRRCSDAIAAVVAPYAKREVEPLGYDLPSTPIFTLFLILRALLLI